MLKRIAFAIIPLFAGLFSMCAYAEEDVPFEEGAVLDVQAVRVQDGKFFEYWTFLQKQWRPLMEESKKEGVILSYEVYTSFPRTPQDANLYLVVKYANYAALDGIDTKVNAMVKKMFALSPEKAEVQAGTRDPIRTILGDEFIRELKFK